MKNNEISVFIIYKNQIDNLSQFSIQSILNQKNIEYKLYFLNIGSTTTNFSNFSFKNDIIYHELFNYDIKETIKYACKNANSDLVTFVNPLNYYANENILYYYKNILNKNINISWAWSLNNSLFTNEYNNKNLNLIFKNLNEYSLFEYWINNDLIIPFYGSCFNKKTLVNLLRTIKTSHDINRFELNIMFEFNKCGYLSSKIPIIGISSELIYRNDTDNFIYNLNYIIYKFKKKCLKFSIYFLTKKIFTKDSDQNIINYKIYNYHNLNLVQIFKKKISFCKNLLIRFNQRNRYDI